MNSSFYGGRWGKNFEIKKIFQNKNELSLDLNNSDSSVFCGDLVFISYGNNYDENLNIDNGKSYNNTLWKKDYLLKNDELINIEIIENETNPKLVYRQLANITGIPAKFKVGSVETLPSGEEAKVTIDSSDIQNPIISFSIPKGDTGSQGMPGYYFIPFVSSDGIISWTNNGDLENPQSVNIKGPQGIQGPVGYYFIPSVSPEGIISWSNNGNLNNPEEINIKGPKGDQGPIGYYFTPIVDNQGNLSWINNGSLKNPDSINIRGPQGEIGPRGYYFIPSVSPDGIISWSNDGGLQNPDSINIRGPIGYYFTPNVNEDGILSWTNNGELENPQSVNIKGPKGDNGTSFTIKGMYPTLEDLKLVHPIGNPGDAYAIGNEFDNTIYLWSVETNEWISLGKIQGPQGQPGEPVSWGEF